MQKIKILFLLGEFSLGGKEKQLTEIIKNLPSEKYESFLFYKSDPEENFSGIEPYLKDYCNLNVNHFGLSSFFKLRTFLKKVEPDVVFSMATTASHLALVNKFLFLSTYKIINASIRDAPAKMTLTLKIEAKLFDLYRNVLANSYAGLKVYGQLNKKGRLVLFNGINLVSVKREEIKLAIKSKYGISTPFSVVMVANFTENKDFERFLNIAKSVNTKRNNISFIAVGGGLLLEKAKMKVEKEEIHNVFFTGRVHNPEDFVSVSDIGVLLSNTKIHGEGISNSIMEYMVQGKPVLANDAGGTKEIITDKINGYLLHEESEEQIALMISDLIDNENKRKEMGAAGREIIEKRFSIQNMISNFEKIILDTMKNN